MVSSPAPERISVLVPVFNESKNISALCDQLWSVLGTLGRPFEVIFVNDGSTDDSLAELMKAAVIRPELKIIDFRRNYGQTAAIMAAIDHATGDILIPIDADLQNDPADIPRLLAKLEEGYDVVSGWRKNRKDERLRRNLPSRVANKLISWISGVHLHDYGCTLKAYRSDVLKGARLYGEMHRFIPIYATWLGASVTELPVNHRARLHGTSNYGLERVVKVLLDVFVVRFLDRHFNKPIYIFGGFGLVSLAISFVTLLLVIYLRLFENISMILTPLPMLAVMTFITGMMSLLMGLLAEMLVRTYYESQNKRTYAVKNKVNF